MRHPSIPLIVFLCSAFFLRAQAQDLDTSRPFCTEGGLCIPDSIEIIFTTDPDSSSYLELRHIGVDGLIESEAVIDVQSTPMQGWSFAVKHDPAYVSLLDDSVTTAGTATEQAMIQPAFDATQPAEGGYITAVVLAFLEETSLPLGRQSVVRASYHLEAEPDREGTLIQPVHGEIALQGSPPTEITITVDGIARQPATLVDGIIFDGGPGETECDNGLDDDEDGWADCNDRDCQRDGACPPCDEWGFYFGEEATEEVLDATGVDELPISMRNATPVYGFQLGVEIEEVAGVYNYSFSSELGTHADRRVRLAITDDAAVSHAPSSGHEAILDAFPSAIRRGSALEPTAESDFFIHDLAPAEGGPGFTVGYLLDIEEEAVEALPITDPDRNLCPTQEILILDLVSPAATFRRGHLSGEERLTITEVVLFLQVLIGSREPLFDCNAALDMNDDGAVNVTDAVTLLRYLFLGGAPLPPPFDACGVDPTPDGAGCNEPDPFCE